MSKINLQFLSDFEEEINRFSNAIHEANDNCTTLLNNPGFNSKKP